MYTTSGEFKIQTHLSKDAERTGEHIFKKDAPPTTQNNYNEQ